MKNVIPKSLILALTLALTLALLAVAATGLWAWMEITRPVKFDAGEVELNVKKGMSFKQALRALNQKGMNRNAALFYAVGIYSGMDRKLKSGYYALKSGMTPAEILDKFVRGDTIKVKLTVIPGGTIRGVAGIFEKAGVAAATDFLEMSADKELLAALKIDAPSLEGFLMPDTYLFEKGVTPREAVQTMVGNLRKRYPAGFYARLSELGMSETEVLALASIIEREAAVDEERAVISAVYHNRLRIGMRLEADPTCIYGIKSFKEGVRHSDILNDSPYNTYRIRGLPPGPIAMPSQKSIVAALYPTGDPFLFFVSNNDGTHSFSTTFGRHRKAVGVLAKKKAAERKSEKSKLKG
jgi:UPF0755 protein